jgi:hypothetical protein
MVKRVSRTDQRTYDDAWRVLQCPFASGCTPVTIHLNFLSSQDCTAVSIDSRSALARLYWLLLDGQARVSTYPPVSENSYSSCLKTFPFSADSAGIPHSYPLYTQICYTWFINQERDKTITYHLHIQSNIGGTTFEPAQG